MIGRAREQALQCESFHSNTKLKLSAATNFTAEVKDDDCPLSGADDHSTAAVVRGELGTRKKKDHHRSGRRWACRNRPAIHASADPVSADGSTRHRGGYGRPMAQIGTRAHAANE